VARGDAFRECEAIQDDDQDCVREDGHEGPHVILFPRGRCGDVSDYGGQSFQCQQERGHDGAHTWTMRLPAEPDVPRGTIRNDDVGHGPTCACVLCIVRRGCGAVEDGCDPKYTVREEPKPSGQCLIEVSGAAGLYRCEFSGSHMGLHSKQVGPEAWAWPAVDAKWCRAVVVDIERQAYACGRDDGHDGVHETLDGKWWANSRLPRPEPGSRYTADDLRSAEEMGYERARGRCEVAPCGRLQGHEGLHTQDKLYVEDENGIGLSRVNFEPQCGGKLSRSGPLRCTRAFAHHGPCQHIPTLATTRLEGFGNAGNRCEAVQNDRRRCEKAKGHKGWHQVPPGGAWTMEQDLDHDQVDEPEALMCGELFMLALAGPYRCELSRGHDGDHALESGSGQDEAEEREKGRTPGTYNPQTLERYPGRLDEVDDQCDEQVASDTSIDGFLFCRFRRGHGGEHQADESCVQEEACRFRSGHDGDCHPMVDEAGTQASLSSGLFGADLDAARPTDSPPETPCGICYAWVLGDHHGRKGRYCTRPSGHTGEHREKAGRSVPHRQDGLACKDHGFDCPPLSRMCGEAPNCTLTKGHEGEHVDCSDQEPEASLFGAGPCGWLLMGEGSSRCDQPVGHDGMHAGPEEPALENAPCGNEDGCGFVCALAKGHGGLHASF